MNTANTELSAVEWILPWAEREREREREGAVTSTDFVMNRYSVL
jgi:hypothetical protein